MSHLKKVFILFLSVTGVVKAQSVPTIDTETNKLISDIVSLVRATAPDCKGGVVAPDCRGN